MSLEFILKIFIYKTAIIAITTLILFEIIVGSKIKSIKSEMSQITSEQNREKIITNIREEIGKANKKENYFVFSRARWFIQFFRGIDFLSGSNGE